MFVQNNLHLFKYSHFVFLVLRNIFIETSIGPNSDIRPESLETPVFCKTIGHNLPYLTTEIYLDYHILTT